MLRDAAPVNGRAAESTATRVETVSAKEPGSSRVESEAGIRAADSTQRETRSRSGRGLPSSHTQNERPPKSATTPRPSSFFSLSADELSHSNAPLKTTHFSAHSQDDSLYSSPDNSEQMVS